MLFYNLICGMQWYTFFLFLSSVVNGIIPFLFSSFSIALLHEFVYALENALDLSKYMYKMQFSMPKRNAQSETGAKN